MIPSSTESCGPQRARPRARRPRARTRARRHVAVTSASTKSAMVIWARTRQNGRDASVDVRGPPRRIQNSSETVVACPRAGRARIILAAAIKLARPPWIFSGPSKHRSGTQGRAMRSKENAKGFLATEGNAPPEHCKTSNAVQNKLTLPRTPTYECNAYVITWHARRWYT